MRDVFYTIVIIWVAMRIYRSFQSHKQNFQQPTRQREGDVTIQTKTSNNKPDDSGEYVDFEEIKD